MRKDGDIVKKSRRGGYSLVELIIAMGISAIVLASLLALLGYGAHNMRVSQALVALQNQAKDATNHISTYTMEASDVEWDEHKKVLTVTKKSVPQELELQPDGTKKYPAPVEEKCYYWKGTDAIYFAKRDKVVDPSDNTKVNLTEGQQFLLAEDMQDFDCKIKKDKKTGKKVLHLEMKLSNSITEFTCKKDIYMRNQSGAESAKNPI